MQVEIKVTGLEAVQAKLQEIQAKGEDTAPLMAEIANYLHNVVDTSFEKQMTPDGKKWSPLKQPRKSGNHPNKLLFDEGDMQGSLTSDSSKDEAIVGLNATSNDYPYPIVHQFGTTDGKTEARGFMPMSSDGKIFDETLNEIDEIIEDYIQEVLK